VRLKPVAVAHPVEPLVDTTIAGTHIPAGTSLWLLIRQASLCAEGSQDARDFDPARWVGDGALQRDPKSFLAFGAGPRFCPGRNLAFLESKTAMAMIARNFEVKLDESHGPVEEKFSFTMIPHGLHLRLRERVSAKPMPVGASA
jgi:cytochrome P450